MPSRTPSTALHRLPQPSRHFAALCGPSLPFADLASHTAHRSSPPLRYCHSNFDLNMPPNSFGGFGPTDQEFEAKLVRNGTNIHSDMSS